MTHTIDDKAVRKSIGRPLTYRDAARLGATRWLGQGYNLTGTSLVAQHLAQVQYPESDQYTRLRANTTQDYFNDSYTGELKDLRQAIQAGLLRWRVAARATKPQRSTKALDGRAEDA